MSFFSALVGDIQNLFHRPQQGPPGPQPAPQASPYAGNAQNLFHAANPAPAQQQPMPGAMPQAPQQQAPPPDSFHNFFFRNVVNPTLNTGAKVLNTVGAGVAGYEDAARIAMAEQTNNQAALQNAVAQSHADQNILNPGNGFRGQGGYMNQQQATSSGDGFSGLAKNFIAPTAAATADVAPYVLGNEFGGAADNLVGKPIADAAGNLINKAGIGTHIAADAVGNAAVGAGANATQQLASTGKINAGDVGKAAVTNGALAGVIGGAGTILGNGFHGLPSEPTLQQAIHDHVTQPTPPNSINSFAKSSDSPLAQAIHTHITQPAPETPQIPEVHSYLASKQPTADAAAATQPTKAEVDMGGALGMSKQDVATAKANNTYPDELRSRLGQLSPEDKADIPPKIQSSIHATLNGQDTPLRTPEENRALNPFKSNTEHVKAGNYDGAIAQAQQVYHDARSRGEQTLHIFDKLSKDEKSNFMRYRESTPENASPKLKEALRRFGQLTDAIHAHSQSEFLGGNTNYLKNYAIHSWDLPENYDMESLINGGGKTFQGLNNISRKHATIADGEAAGLKLNDSPKQVRKQIESYANASAHALKKQALRQGFIEADAGELKKTGNLTLGVDDTIPLSEKGVKAARGVQWSKASNNLAIRGYRKLNRGAIQSLLTHTGVHEFNITSRAAPGLQLSGHPIAAVKATVGGLRGNFDKAYVDRIKQRAIEDGTASDAARIGASFSEGHGLLDRQLTPIHDQVVRSVLKDLKNRGIDLNSAEARKYGKAANGMMGEVNYELLHTTPKVRRALGDVFLAKQFTPSKFVRLHQAFTDLSGGGHYARATIAGNAMLATSVIAGLGYAAKQKSDNMRDVLLRAIFDPAVPTPWKDSKGNNEQIKLLGTDTSDVAKLLGITLTRQKDGHLGVNWKPTNLPGTVTDYLRARLAPLLGDALKVATNTNYAGKPLYDPNASLSARAGQIATTLGVGHLPIPAQTLAYTNLVKSHMPGTSQEILNANTPRVNPGLNALLGVGGATINTDKTTGKGLQSAQYYAALEDAKQGLNRQATDAFDIYTGGKKNPVTGQYEIDPNANDSRAKATALLDNPDALSHIIDMNKKLASEGQSVDPLFKQNPDNIKAYLQYQAMPEGGPDRTDWMNKNQSWYQPLMDQRNAFFNTLPAGDPNKPQLNIQYPTASPQVQNLMTQYDNLTDSASKAAFIDAHPEVLAQWAKQSQYTNQMREAQGYAAIKGAPQVSAQLQAYMTKYNAASKADRKAIRNADPGSYQQMIGYYDKLDVYNINKQGGVSMLEGEPDTTSKQLKAVQSLSQDIVQSPNGNYDIMPAAWMSGLGGGSGGGSGSYKKSGGKSKKSSTSMPMKGLPGVKLHLKRPTKRFNPIQANYMPNKLLNSTRPQQAFAKRTPAQLKKFKTPK